MVYPSWISSKISKIMHEGIRRNTKKVVSSRNPRRKVSQKQAVAVAYSMAREKGLKIPRKKKRAKWAK